ncbi:hypothetical protein HHK36_030684 [Tetracentron sinense]|uniref:Aquaporin n=1 Tax=Tetracentron sinense TaxID=13715 RepID=A0A834YAA7_TETSI|nr:hypothetical protein HHK36_030684 [Tetracentron sinense]
MFFYAQVMAELLGTYILMFVGLGSVLISYKQPLTIVGIAVAWGLVVMVMIYTFGHISGGHFNPAVTIASAVSCKFPWRHVPKYIGVQLLASTLAALTLSVLFHGQESIGDTLTLYKSPTTTFEALTWEFIISFILMLTVCGVATDHRAVRYSNFHSQLLKQINELSGVAVGAAILFNCLIAGWFCRPITGASMNPARSIGPAIVSGNYSNIWVYIVAPILGTTAAGFIYSFLRLPLAKTSESTTKSI